MRILQVVPTYLPARRYGGPIVAVHGLARALAERNHQVDVFTTNVDGPGVSDVPTDRIVEIDGVRVRYFPAAIARLYYSPAMSAALAAAARDYDVIHSHAVFLWPGVAAGSAARAAGVPHVVSPRGMLVPELIARKSRWAKSAWIEAFERRRFRRAAAIHFTSAIERDDALRMHMPVPREMTIPNGIDLVSRPAVEREERMLLFLGRISWKKGLERLIRAIPALGARLVIAGNDEEELTPRLRELAAGVGANVDFVGPVYGDAKYELLARATVFVLLSDSENFGNSVLEAMMMETPVVLSEHVGIAPDVVTARAGAIGVDALPTLLADAGKRAAMGRNGRALVESVFAWPRVAERMEEAFCSIRSRP